MPFDALTMSAVSDDVRAVGQDARIQKILQPSAESVALRLYKGSEHTLLLSADVRFARTQIVSGRMAKAFATPSPFIMLLRKHLEDGRLVAIEAVRTERILSLSVAHQGEVRRLITEVMGKHSNIILVDSGERILGAVKVVPSRQSRVRPIIPGHQYRPPPVQERDLTIYPEGPRLDPMRDSSELESTLAEFAVGTPLRAALLGILAGCSPFLADQIAMAAGLDSRAPLEPSQVPGLVSAAGPYYMLYETHAWRPTSFKDRRGRLDFAPYVPRGMDDVEEQPSTSQAIERAVQADESRDVLGSSRGLLLGEIGRKLGSARRKLQSLRRGLTAAADAESALYQGQLVMAYQHAAEPGAAELVITDLDTVIPLDPKLSAQENAERFIKRYQKLRDAGKRLPAMIAEAEAETARLEDLEAFVGLAESEADLRDLGRELSPRGSTNAISRSKQSKARRGPARYAYDGFTVVAGRNARENEEVTFRLAGRQDLWLHARGRPGSHVVLRVNGGETPEQVLLRAAQLAGYLSSGRTDSAVDVDVTDVRNVRKIPGGAPGRVTYRNFRTFRVKPTSEGWSAVR